jgi:hypothetical protein
VLAAIAFGVKWYRQQRYELIIDNQNLNLTQISGHTEQQIMIYDKKK